MENPEKEGSSNKEEAIRDEPGATGGRPEREIDAEMRQLLEETRRAAEERQPARDNALENLLRQTGASTQRTAGVLLLVQAALVGGAVWLLWRLAVAHGAAIGVHSSAGSPADWIMGVLCVA